MQLGILNVVQAMELSTELVYPLYVAASSDWYFLFFFEANSAELDVFRFSFR